MVDTAAQKKIIFQKLFCKDRKNIIMTGDSIAYRLSLEGNKSNYLFRKTSGHYLFTSAFSGSKMGNYTTGDFASWNPWSFVTRSDSAATNAFDVTNCDLLIVWAGFNDKNTPIALGTNTSTDSNTYAGAIRNGITNYQARNPNMVIMFITPNANPYEVNNANGKNIVDYRDMVISVCGLLNIPVYDEYSLCGITDANKGTTIDPDHIHPVSATLEGWAPEQAAYILSNIVFT